MLSRFISKPSHHLRFFSLLISSQSHPKLHQYHHHSPSNPNFSSFNILPKYFSTNNDNGDGNWKFTSEIEDSGGLGGIFDAEVSKEDDNDGDDLFKADTVPEAAGVNEDWTNVKDADDDNGDGDLFKGIDHSVKEVGRDGDEDWTNVKDDADNEDGDLFKGIDQSVTEAGRDGNEDWVTADGFEPWDLATEGKEVEDVFDIGQSEMTGFPDGELVDVESEKRKEEKVQLQKEEKELAAVLKGPNRAFGDLVATSGITEEMLESLIALKDLEGIQGLPPLSEIEDMRYEKNTRKSARADIERQKQEEVANARVRKIDGKGRAYGTGRRKCSIARVWIQPGEGKFVVNEKQFDVYFPMLEQRAALLRPFTETKTLGYWDVYCTVKGGGFSGQVGAVRLGISKALQNWAPGLRPPLKEAGFLTRDSRVVERKKPGKAKARKSFQWVKR